MATLAQVKFSPSMTTSNMCKCWLERVVLFASNRTPCYSVKSDLKHNFLEYRQIIGLKTVHERNPAPVDVINISFFAGLIWWLSHYLQGLYGKYPIILQGFHTCQVVVKGISEPSTTYGPNTIRRPDLRMELLIRFLALKKKKHLGFCETSKTGLWFLIFFMFTPKNWGTSIQCDVHIFRNWSVKNHQLENIHSTLKADEDMWHFFTW